MLRKYQVYFLMKTLYARLALTMVTVCLSGLPTSQNSRETHFLLRIQRNSLDILRDLLYVWFMIVIIYICAKCRRRRPLPPRRLQRLAQQDSTRQVPEALRSSELGFVDHPVKTPGFHKCLMNPPLRDYHQHCGMTHRAQSNAYI